MSWYLAAVIAIVLYFWAFDLEPWVPIISAGLVTIAAVISLGIAAKLP